ncbi:MAG: hypothetical protein GY810_10960 [Aureispira sp.]|nr:hypothetical protein [Aureispira sp.]
MNSIFSLEIIIYWATAIGFLVGLAFLGRQFHKAWLILLLEPVWSLAYYIFDALRGGSLELLFYLLEGPVLTNILTIAVIVYGYNHWTKAKMVTYDTLNSNSSDILDDVHVQHTRIATQHLSSQTMMDPITFGIIGLVSLTILKALFLGYGLNYYTIVSNVLEIGFLLGLYLLGKRYIEGWLVLIFVALGQQFAWGFMFHWTIFYPILQIGICVWSYTEWKKYISIEPA